VKLQLPNYRPHGFTDDNRIKEVVLSNQRATKSLSKRTERIFFLIGRFHEFSQGVMVGLRAVCVQFEAVRPLLVDIAPRSFVDITEELLTTKKYNIFTMSNSKRPKRDRGPNFTKEEDLIANLVETYRHVIENKMTDAVTSRDKEAAWQEIETRFSPQSGSFRNWHQLKNCWDNLKKKKKLLCRTSRRFAPHYRYARCFFPPLFITFEFYFYEFSYFQAKYCFFFIINKECFLTRYL